MGHSVLVVPVPQLEELVRARTVQYDADYLSGDPAFTHAHITVLGPFVEQLTPEVDDRVATLAAAQAPFDFELEEVATFPNGIIHLLPQPDGGFRELTRRFVEAFPGFPPYAGAFPDPKPHLTLDARSEQVSEESTRRLLGTTVPVACRAERLDLAWYAAGECRVLASWPLGTALPDVGVAG